MKNCPFCYAQNPDDSIFCLSCGQNMSTAQAPPVEQNQEIYQQPQQPSAQGSYSQPYAPPPPSYQPVPSYPAPPPVVTGPPKPGNPSVNWAAILGMILGILSLVLCCVNYLNVILSISGMIFSVMGLKSQQKGMAIAGIVTSGVGILVGIVLVIGSIFAVSWLNGITGELYNALEDSGLESFLKVSFLQ